MLVKIEGISPTELDEALNGFCNVYAAATAYYEQNGQKVLIPSFQNGQLTSLKPERIYQDMASDIVDRLDWQKIVGHLVVTQQVAQYIGGECTQIAINLTLCQNLVNRYLRSKTEDNKYAMLWAIDTVFKDPNNPDESSLPRALQFMKAFESEEHPVLQRYINQT